MNINFHDEENRKSYTGRSADRTWKEVMDKLVDFKTVTQAADVGCGGGIYSKALSDLGADNITGVDFSEAMLSGAKEKCAEYENITFRKGTAFDTGLDGGSYDLLLERALIHHIEDLNMCFIEGYRALKDEGIFIVQDRTFEDCMLKGDDVNIRSHFTELYPKLADKEAERRHSSDAVTEALEAAGFSYIEEVKLWETRAVYADKKEFLNDVSNRTGEKYSA